MSQENVEIVRRVYDAFGQATSTRRRLSSPTRCV